MRNAKITRQLLHSSPVEASKSRRKQSQTIHKLRRQLAREQHLQAAMNTENSQLRARLSSRKEIKLPISLLDQIMEQFIEELAKELTKRVLANDPEGLWVRMTKQAAQMMLAEAYEGHHSTFCLEDSFTLFVEEAIEDGDLDIGFKVQCISAHKVLPKHVRKSAIMHSPNTKMFLLDDVEPVPTYATGHECSSAMPISVF